MYGVMYLAGISLLCTVTVLFMHHRHHRRRPVPRLLRFIVHDVIGRMLCINDNKSQAVLQSTSDSLAKSDTSVTDAETTSRRQYEANDDENTSNNSTATTSDTDHQQRIRDEWIDTARIMDRFFLVVLIVIIAAMTIVLLAVIAVNGPRKVEPITPNFAADSDE